MKFAHELRSARAELRWPPGRSEFFPHWSENLWQITVCEKDLCETPNDEYALVSFVREGFDLRGGDGGQVARSADQFLLLTLGVLMWAWR